MKNDAPYNFYDDIVAQLRDLWWPKRYPLLLLPLALLIAGFVLAYEHAYAIVQQEASGSSFFATLLGMGHAYFSFNLFYFPALVVVNLFTLHLIKPNANGEPVNVAGALLSSIGWKFFKLLPLLVLWMICQFIIAIFIVLIGLIAILSRGHVGGGAAKSLFTAITVFVTIMFTLLFTITPGMVMDGKGMFASLKTMNGYMKKYYGRVLLKAFIGMAVYALLAYVVLHVLDWVVRQFNLDYPLAIFYATWCIVLLFVFYVQLKFGEFYLKCATENSAAHGLQPGHHK